MAALIWRLAGVGLLAALVAGGLWKAYDLGREVERAKAAAVLAEWKASILEQFLRHREAQRERLDALQGELDELRSRPEKIRTVVRRVEVRPDDTCRSLPAAWKRLWDADADSVRAHPEPASAGLDDGSRVALADAAESIRIARERFETNAARLTALQMYIRSVVLHETGAQQ